MAITERCESSMSVLSQLKPVACRKMKRSRQSSEAGALLQFDFGLANISFRKYIHPTEKAYPGVYARIRRAVSGTLIGTRLYSACIFRLARKKFTILRFRVST